MIDYKKLEEYELNERDIDTVLNYLQIVDPENANPENAIDFLIFYRTAIHDIGHKITDEELKRLYEQFSAQGR